MLCYETPCAAHGLDICLICFSGLCCGERNHSALHARKTGHNLRLNLRTREVPKPERSSDEAEVKKPRVIQLENVEVEHEYTVYCAVCRTEVERTLGKLPEAIDALVLSQSAMDKVALETFTEPDLSECEHTLCLEQAANANMITSTEHVRCGDCDLTSNLWLCMTCGYLGCGRRQFDGSGGNGHAIDHSHGAGHWLVCKLGTITPEGSADLYCYKCDDARKDESLAQHLAHFGIDVASQTKTEASMAELSIEQTLNIKFDSDVDDGVKRTPAYGPGLCGLVNIGNTCYMNSVLQTLAHHDKFMERYFEPFAEHILECKMLRPSQCWQCQWGKLFYGILSGEFSEPPSSDDPTASKARGISPRMLRQLVCKGSAEFLSGRQQDAMEFMQFVLTQIRREEHRNGPLADPTRFFDFTRQARFECQTCGGVRYVDEPASNLELDVTIDKADNAAAVLAAKAEYGDKLKAYEAQYQAELAAAKAEFDAKRAERVAQKEAEAAAQRAAAAATMTLETGTASLDGAESRDATPAAAAAGDAKPQDSGDVFKPPPKKYPKYEGPVPEVPFESCFRSSCAAEVVDFSCPSCATRTKAVKRTLFKNFPDTLLIQFRRFEFFGIIPRKLDANVHVPMSVDLSDYQSRGLQPGERELPESAASAPAAAAAPQIDAAMLQQMLDMGFPELRCRRALAKTSNASSEAAIMWLFEHESDADIDAPLEPAAPAAPALDEAVVSQLCDMGFARPGVVYALQRTQGDLERAIEFLFSHDVDAEMRSAAEASLQIEPQSNAAAPEPTDVRPPRYELVAAVDHRGVSYESGHYVAHVRTGDNWFLFNDARVFSEPEPMLAKAYFYMYRKAD